MKAGQASRTAELVCMARAAAHGRCSVARYDDPTAMALLPPPLRARVEAYREGIPPRGVGERLTRRFLEVRSLVMVARAVAIDDALRAAPPPQLVTLGAGLDGRAWRLPELRDTVVFEVAHPDSQREKRERVAALPRHAREVHFVPVDFTRDDLGAALAGAGHDPGRATSWLWEGVVMYLEADAISATLQAIGRRSAPGSRLLILYMSPGVMRALVGVLVRFLGEPVRLVFRPEEMVRLLRDHDWQVVSDEDLHTFGATLAPDVGEATRVARHLRLVVAERT